MKLSPLEFTMRFFIIIPSYRIKRANEFLVPELGGSVNTNEIESVNHRFIEFRCKMISSAEAPLSYVERF